MRQHFKLYISSIKINTYNQKATTATVEARIELPDIIFYYMNYDKLTGIDSGVVISVKATTIVHPEDTFDEEKGRRIAESKAMIKAYEQYVQFLEKLYSAFFKLLFGNNISSIRYDIPDTGGISAAIIKAKAMLDSEVSHFYELIDEK